MKCVFRVDASIAIGTGHVMRCRTLAMELQKRGAKIQFIIRAHAGHLGDLLVHDGFEVTLLPKPEVSMPIIESYANWLGVDQQEDAMQSIKAIENQSCDWLIVDHYGLDHVWEKQLLRHTRKLMVIDDLANRAHTCDLLLDQNYVVAAEDRYRPLVPDNCQMLLGPRYALLRPEYSEYRDKIVACMGNIRRVFVFLGGSDKDNVTGKVLAALNADQLAHLEVDVVIGANFIHRKDVTQQANSRPNTQIHGPRPHLADLMAKADLAIGAGGTTLWERLCLGLPSLVISIAENQKPASEALSRDGLIQYLGSALDLDVAAIKSALISVLAETGRSQNLAASRQALVDGRGALRVAEALIPTHSLDLTIRHANGHDALTYFSWVNDPVVRSSANNSTPISVESHLRWFNDRLKDSNSYLYVLEARGLPIGQVRFDVHKSEATIDYSIDVLVRGRRLASVLLTLGMSMLKPKSPFIFKAEVKLGNIASAATFIRLGFTKNKCAKDNGNLCFELYSAPINDEILNKSESILNA